MRSRSTSPTTSATSTPEQQHHAPESRWSPLGCGTGGDTVTGRPRSTTITERSTHQALADERNDAVLIYVDGTYATRDEARVSVFDSAFLVGDGIWEGIRLHHGEFAFLDRHLDRLFHGLATVRIDIGRTREEVADLLHEVVDRNGMADGVHVRLMVSRGRKKTPSQHPSNLAGGPTIVVIPEYKVADPAVAARGIRLLTSSVRRPPPDTLDQRLNCHSKLHEVVALIEAVEAGCDEALMLDTTGAVATCNATNFFIVTDGELVTSTGLHSLPGITRAVVLEEARAAGIATAERPFPPEDVHTADEAFVTGTFGGLTPVIEVDGHADPRRRRRSRHRPAAGAAPRRRRALGRRAGRTPARPVSGLGSNDGTLRVNVWSGPRNVSTALMYAFRQRPDTTVLDEPLYGYYLRVTGADHPGAGEVVAAMETDGHEVVRTILGPWPTPVLVCKQMAHHLVALDDAWLDRCRNVLLVREPTEVLASYTEQVDRPTLEMLGYPTQVRLLEAADTAGVDLPIVDARLLLSDPRGVLARLCDRLGLAFTDAMLTWPAGPKPEDGVWAPHWYAGVHGSTGFQPPRPPRGPEAVRPADRALLASAQPLYDRLRTRALTP